MSENNQVEGVQVWFVVLPDGGMYGTRIEGENAVPPGPVGFETVEMAQATAKLVRGFAKRYPLSIAKAWCILHGLTLFIRRADGDSAYCTDTVAPRMVARKPLLGGVDLPPELASQLVQLGRMQRSGGSNNR